jgi:hypothetical protein
MGLVWSGVLAAALLIGVARAAYGGQHLSRSPSAVAAATPLGTTEMPLAGAATGAASAKRALDDDPQVSAQRLVAALRDRLTPIETRLREDTRVRHAGAAVGLGAIALGALRRDHPLTLIGMGALRLGLDGQLSSINRTSGFSVSPRLERRGFSIFLTRKFR